MLLIKLDVGGKQHEAVEALVFFFIFYVLLCRAFFTMAHDKGRSLPCV
jgi:hypothetical protein